jgi:hypothetical protein
MGSGAADQGGWESDSKRPGGLKIDDEFDPYGRSAGLAPLRIRRPRGTWDLLRPMIERHMCWIQPYLRAKRSMIALNFGSFTFSAASEAESHFTTRSCFSGHCLFWRLT